MHAVVLKWACQEFEGYRIWANSLSGD